MSRLLVSPHLSLYIHIPWCLAKCPYCDFNSHAVAADLDEAAYVDALLADLDLELPQVAGRELVSIFTTMVEIVPEDNRTQQIMHPATMPIPIMAGTTATTEVTAATEGSAVDNTSTSLT